MTCEKNYTLPRDNFPYHGRQRSYLAVYSPYCYPRSSQRDLSAVYLPRICPFSPAHLSLIFAVSQLSLSMYESSLDGLEICSFSKAACLFAGGSDVDAGWTTPTAPAQCSPKRPQPLPEKTRARKSWSRVVSLSQNCLL